MKLKKMLLLMLAISLMAALGACAREDAAGKSTDATSTGSNVSETASSGSGTLGDYSVCILDYDLIKDYQDKDAIRVYFEFTNNGEDAASFMFSIGTKAFQNGVELETAIVMDGADEDDNSIKEIKKGVTINCTKIYVLSDTSPVEIEASELLSFSDDVLTKTFDIAK